LKRSWTNPKKRIRFLARPPKICSDLSGMGSMSVWLLGFFWPKAGWAPARIAPLPNYPTGMSRTKWSRDHSCPCLNPCNELIPIKMGRLLKSQPIRINRDFYIDKLRGEYCHRSLWDCHDSREPTCGSQRMMTMGGLKLLIILTESQRRMAMTANKFCQYPVILHDHLSISVKNV
jgi:hypothetical protein